MSQTKIILMRSLCGEAYIEGDNDAGGVIGRKLDGGAEEAMEI